MRGERLKQYEKVTQHATRMRLPCHGFVDENHQGRDGRVEPEALQILSDFPDAGVEGFELGGRWLEVFDRRIELDLLQQLSGALRFRTQVLLELGLAGFINEQTPNLTKETINALDAFRAPRFDHLQRAQEHFIEAKSIGAILGYHVVGIDYVATGLGHLLAVFAEDEALVDEFEKRLRRADVAEVEEQFVPEPGVEQVQDGVLGAPDVEINARRGFGW